MQTADGHDAKAIDAARRHLAAGDGLQTHDGATGHDDRVDGELRHGGVAAAAVEGDFKAVRGGHLGAWFHAHGARAGGEDVLAKEDVWDGDVVGGGWGEEAVGDHAVGAVTKFLSGLEEDYERPVPAGAERGGGEGFCGGEEAGHVHIVATGVHGGFEFVVIVGVLGCFFAGVGEVGLFVDGEGV